MFENFILAVSRLQSDSSQQVPAQFTQIVRFIWQSLLPYWETPNASNKAFGHKKKKKDKAPVYDYNLYYQS